MVPIEIISNLVRPLSLGLRLANVMMGDHAVLGIFLELTYFVIPVIFYMLGMFVGFVSALCYRFYDDETRDHEEKTGDGNKRKYC